MSDKNYMIACNKDYNKRVFMIAMFYQDPDTGEITMTEDGIDELTHDSFLSMTEEEFNAEFEAWASSQKPKH